MKFAHLGDCHLGGWRQPELRELNLQSFKKALDLCIKNKVDFVLIAGDLFDSAFPPIEILRETFSELKRLQDAEIPVFYIAGSHDFSASGKSFLDVIESSGFAKNLLNVVERESISGETKETKEERKKDIILAPIIHKNVALYGYPGKKSGMEVEDLRRVKVQDSPGFFRVFALHTTVTGAKGTLPIDSVDEDKLPKAEYYALGHLHLDYNKDRFVYSGPIFPNNFQELEELKRGSFYIVDTNPFSAEKIKLNLIDVEVIEIEISNALIATEQILAGIEKRNIQNKIVLLKVSGRLEKGKTSNIRFQEIEKKARELGAYSFLKNTNKLVVEETEIEIEVGDVAKLEDEIIKKYSEENESDFNMLIPTLINVFSVEKQEGEKNQVYEERLFSEMKKILKVEG